MTGIPIYNVNNNCSTGSTALFMAKQFVEGGLAECAMALGFEKMEKGSLGIKYTDRTNPIDKHFEAMIELRGFAKAPPRRRCSATPAASTWRGTAPRRSTSRRSAGRTTSTRSTTRTRSSRTSTRSRTSSTRRMVYEPLTKLQCCPTSDGAGAAILASEDFVKSSTGSRTRPSRSPAWR